MIKPAYVGLGYEHGLFGNWFNFTLSKYVMWTPD